MGNELKNIQSFNFLLPVAGILITFLFRVLLDWKHKIAMEYTSKRDVAISMLQGKFVEKTSNHFTEISKEKEVENSSLQEIYKKPGKINVIQTLSSYGENISKVKRLFSQTDSLCNLAIYLNCFSIFIILFQGFNTYFKLLDVDLADFYKIIYIVTIVVFFLVIIRLLDRSNKFLKLVNTIIEPET